jgi:hypothetical protein
MNSGTKWPDRILTDSLLGTPVVDSIESRTNWEKNVGTLGITN